MVGGLSLSASETLDICIRRLPEGEACVLTIAEFEAADLAAARAAVKAYARVVQDDEDALTQELAATALLLCEAFTRRIGLAREVVEVLPCADAWKRLGAGPVRAVTLVEGLPTEGATFSLPVGSYAIDIDADGAGWVRVTAPGALRQGPRHAAGRVRVTYEAGLASGWEGLPETLRQGVVRLATHLLTHRDDAREGPPPAAVSALWRPWRVISLSQGERATAA